MAARSDVTVSVAEALFGRAPDLERALSYLRGGERLVTLDGVERTLEPSDLVITDGLRPVAIAGIMGGLESEVTETTTDVLLEAANFEPVGILRTSERLGLRSEASTRWEKGVDPHLARQASVLATPEERRPWVTVDAVARRIEDGLVLDPALEGEELLAAMRATPASEYVVPDPGG